MRGAGCGVRGAQGPRDPGPGLRASGLHVLTARQMAATRNQLLYASRMASAFLLGVSPMDPTDVCRRQGLLASVAGAASYLPARRAARTEPVVALREE